MPPAAAGGRIGLAVLSPEFGVHGAAHFVPPGPPGDIDAVARAPGEPVPAPWGSGALPRSARHEASEARVLGADAETRASAGAHRQLPTAADMVAASTGPLPDAMERDGAARLTLHTPALPARATPDGGVIPVALTQTTPIQPTVASAGSAPMAVLVGPPVTHQDFGDAVVARVFWQIGEGIQQVRFHVHPPELGPLEVRVAVAQDQASVHFLTQHGFVREALEDALPRLRELLGHSGLTLADADVSQQQGRSDARHLDRDGDWHREDSAPAMESAALPVRIAEGYIDEYA